MIWIFLVWSASSVLSYGFIFYDFTEGHERLFGPLDRGDIVVLVVIAFAFCVLGPVALLTVPAAADYFGLRYWYKIKKP